MARKPAKSTSVEPTDSGASTVSPFEALAERVKAAGLPLPVTSPLVPSGETPPTDVIPIPVSYFDHLLKRIVLLEQTLARVQAEYKYGIAELERRYAGGSEDEEGGISFATPTGRNKR